MNLLNKLTIKNLKLNKKRTIVTIVGIVLSVALITAVAAMFFSARDSLIKFEIREKGNFHYVFRDIPDKDFKYFTENRYFETYYFVKNIGYANLEESKNMYKPYIYVSAFDQKSLDNLGINIVEGRLPKNDKEIVIPTHLKTNGRVVYKIGDTIKLNIGKRISDGYELFQNISFTPSAEEEIKDTKEYEYKIVGIIERPSGTIENLSAPGYTFITFLNETNKKGKMDIYTRYTKDVLKEEWKATADILDIDADQYHKYVDMVYISDEQWQEMINEVSKAKYEFGTNDYLITLETNIFNNNSMKNLGTVALIVVAIIIFTSVFCIKNSFDISITEKTKQYGMLVSVGATSKQIKKNVYYEAFILGLIGIPIGIICGLFASYILIIISDMLLQGFRENLELTYSFSYMAILFATILGFLTLYLSAWRSAHKAAKISPITAIRNSGNIKLNAKKIKSPKYVKKIFGIGGDVSYKNLKRNKKKYRTTVISIIVCVAVFIALSSFITLAFDEIKREFKTTDYNISLQYNSLGEKETEEMKNSSLEIVNFDNIRDYSIVSDASIQLEQSQAKYSKEYLKYFPEKKKKRVSYKDVDEKGNEVTYYYEDTISVIKVGDHAYRKYVDKLELNYDEVKNKAILMNYIKTWVPNGENESVQKTVAIYGYKAGEKMTWYKDDNGKPAPIEFEIAAVTEKLPFGIRNYYGGALLIVDDEFFNKNFVQERVYESIYIDSSNPNKLQDEIDEFLKDKDYSLTNVEENVQMMKSFYTLIAIFLYGFITVIALIGVTNIFNTITTNMELRSREFAVLKSIGMTKKEFNRMISLESFFYGTKSLLIGIPIGCILSRIIFIALTDNDNLIHYSLPLTAITISILAVFILITCIMKYSITKINKQNTIETIRNENI